MSITFLQLPGEIRNKIYDLVINDSRVIIAGNHPQKELAFLQQIDPTQRHKQPRYRLSGAFTKHGSGMSLLLTCRQMNQEAVKFVYARTIFCFNAMNTIHKFLNVIPVAGAESIETVEITHRGYAEPMWTDDREWKIRHDIKWKKTLNRIREQVKSLKTLSLDMTFFDWPCRLEMDASWAKVLINFAGEGLDRVNLILDHDRFSKLMLEEATKQLEKRMMTKNGREKKIAEAKMQAESEKKQTEQAKKKTVNILKLRLNAPNNPTAVGMTAKKVVKGKGLEKYARAEPPVAYC